MSSSSRPLYHQQDAAELKRLKEAFVSNLQGTTRWEVFCVLSSLPLCLLTAAYIEARVAARLRSSKLGQHVPPKFVFELCGVVLPLLLLLMSVAPAEPAFLLLFLLWGSLALKLWMRLAHGPAARQHMAHMLQHMSSSRRRFVSAFRGGVMVATSLAILGVDFPAFPRRYAKAEGYGGGVMDVGVGAIVFAGGLVSAVAAAGGAAAAADSAAGLVSAAAAGTTVSSVVRLRLRQLWKGIKAAVPLLLLGGAREIATAFVGYQAHLGEYGLNWNFFFTIAAVTLLTLAVPVPPRWLGPLGVALTAAHQVLLSSLDVSRLVAVGSVTGGGSSGSEESAAIPGSPTATATSRAAAANTSLGAWMHMELGVEARQAAGFWASNKEGLGSLPGYWALYMLGAAIGHQLGVTCALTAAKARAQLHSGGSSGSRPGGTAAAVGEAGRLVWAWVGMWWVVDLLLWGLLAAVEAGVEPVSRRTCNLPYVLWTCAQCLAWLLLVVMAELLTTVICSTSGGCGVTSGSSSLHAPLLPPAAAGAGATTAAGLGHAGRGSARRSLEALISAAAAGGGGGGVSHGNESVSTAGAGGAAAASAAHRPHTPPSPPGTTLQRRSVGRRGGGSSPMAAAAAAAAAITAAGAAAAVGGGSIASGSTAAVAAAATAVVDSSAHHLHHTGSREGSPRKPASSSTSSRGGGGSSSHSSPKGGGVSAGGSDKGSPKGQGGSDNITSSSTGAAAAGGGSGGSTPARSRRPASRLQPQQQPSPQQQQQQQQHVCESSEPASYAGSSSGGPMRLMLAFNRNMLALFMIANLLTGAVNLSINTLAVDSWPARAIVGLYMLLLCSIAVLLDKRSMTLKPW